MDIDWKGASSSSSSSLSGKLRVGRELNEPMIECEQANNKCERSYKCLQQISYSAAEMNEPNVIEAKPTSGNDKNVNNKQMRKNNINYNFNHYCNSDKINQNKSVVAMTKRKQLLETYFSPHKLSQVARKSISLLVTLHTFGCLITLATATSDAVPNSTAAAAATASTALTNCAARFRCGRAATSAPTLRRRRLVGLAKSHKQLSCFCDQNCVHFDDCCADALAANNTFQERVGRANGSHDYWHKRRQQAWQCRRVGAAAPAIKVRARCAPEWAHDATRRKCELFGRNSSARSASSARVGLTRAEVAEMRADPIGNTMPVTDLLSGITYANAHCLRCNSAPLQQQQQQQVDKLIYWSPMVECRYDLERDDRNQLYDLISSEKGRALKFVAERAQWALDLDGELRACRITAAPPPQQVEPLLRRCRPKLIDTCNETLANEKLGHLVAPSVLERARDECHFGHQAIVWQAKADIAYLNGACALCNGQLHVRCERRRPKVPLAGAGTDAADQDSQGLSRLRVAGAGTPLAGLPFGGGGGGVVDDDEDDHDLDLDTDSDDDDDFEEPSGAFAPSARGSSSLHAPGSFSVLLNLYDVDTSGVELPAAAAEAAAATAGEPLPAGPVHRFGSGGHLCPAHTIYDPFLLKCRSLVCGVAQRYERGRCVSQTSAADDTAKRQGGRRAADAGPATTTTTTTSALSPVAATESAAAADESVVGPSESRAVAKGATDESSASARLVESMAAAAAAVSNGAPTTTTTGESAAQRHVTQLTAPSLVERATQLVREDKLQWSALSSAARSAPQQRWQSFAECAKININRTNFCLFAPVDSIEFALDATQNNANETETPRDDDDNATGDASARPIRHSVGRLKRWPIGVELVLVERTGRTLVLRNRFSWTWLGSAGALVDSSGSIWRTFFAFVEPYGLVLGADEFELERRREREHNAASKRRRHLQTGSMAFAPSQPISNGADDADHNSDMSDDHNDTELLMCVPSSFAAVASSFDQQVGALMAKLTTYCLLVSIASLALYLLLYWLSSLDLRSLSVEMMLNDSSDQWLGGARRSSDKMRTISRTSSELTFGSTSASASGAFGSFGVAHTNTATSLSSRGVACLAAALLVAYTLFLIGQRRADALGTSGAPTRRVEFGRALIGAATHCAFLFAFNWMLLLAYDIWRTLRLATFQLRAPVQHAQSARFVAYLSAALAGALIVSSLALLVDQTQPTDLPDQWARFVRAYRPQFGLRPGASWFANGRSLALFFGLPVTLVMLSNLLFFLHTSYMVICTSTSSPPNSPKPAPVARRDPTVAPLPPPDGAPCNCCHSSTAKLALKCDSSLQNLSSLVSLIAKDYRLYCRLSTIMGLTWLTGLLAQLVDSCATLWCLFITLNTLQGLFIFIAFGCKQSKLANLRTILAYANFRSRKWLRGGGGGANGRRKSHSNAFPSSKLAELR